MDLHLDLDAAPGRSLRARCEHALRAAVRRLPAGTRLPPTRALAAELGVSRGVVVEALRAARRRGLPVTRRGGGTLVAGAPHAGGAASRPRSPASRADPPARPPRFDLRPALPALDGAFRPAWGRALDRALRTMPDARLGYPDPRGEPELREALAESLARRRGVQATAAEVRAHRRPRLEPARSSGACSPSAGSSGSRSSTPCWPRLPATLTARRPASRSAIAVDEHGLRHRRARRPTSTRSSSPPRTSTRPARSSPPPAARR